MAIAIATASSASISWGASSLRRSLASIVALALLGAVIPGCSPYVYQDEVGKFGQGVGDLRAAFAASQDATEAAARQADRTRWRRDRAALELSGDCVWGATGPLACTLSPQGSAPRGPTLPQTEAARVAVPMKALADYAATLAEVVNATDRAALDKAVGELRANAVALAAVADGVTGGRGAEVAGPVVGLFATAAGGFLDDRRFRMLRAGVEAADPAVRVLGEPIGRAMQVLAEQRFLEVSDEVRSLTTAQNRASRSGISDQEYDALTAALQDRVDVLQALRRARPRQAADAMVEAHGRLRAALADPETQMAQAIGALRRFVDAARELRAGLAAAKTSQGS